MLLKDRFQLPVTCTTAAVDEDYVAAIDLLLSAWPGAWVRLDHALDADPDFARARIAGLQTLACHGRLPPGDVAPALSEGVGALGRGDNIGAAQILEPA